MNTQISPRNVSASRKLPWLVALLPLVVGAAALNAAIIQADFNESLDLPDYAPSGPRVEQALAVALPSAGPQLTALNITSNPSNWQNSLNVTFDATTDILTLTGDGGNGYQTITVSLNNLLFSSGQQVTGITPITLNSAVTADKGPLSITESFTANSFSVNYSVPLGDHPKNNFFINGGASDTFQVILGPTNGVPETGSTLLLMGLALGSLGLLRRKIVATA